jgi:hypothetical protein
LGDEAAAATACAPATGSARDRFEALAPSA